MKTQNQHDQSEFLRDDARLTLPLEPFIRTVCNSNIAGDKKAEAILEYLAKNPEEAAAHAAVIRGPWDFSQERLPRRGA